MEQYTYLIPVFVVLFVYLGTFVTLVKCKISLEVALILSLLPTWLTVMYILANSGK